MRTSWSWAGFAFLLTAASVSGRSAVPDDLNQWDAICFCQADKSTPHSAVQRDDNGRLLFLARNGATKAQLRAAGIAVTDSQLAYLEDWHLLRRDKDVYTTDVPVLDPVKLQRIRARLTQTAAELTPQMQDGLDALKTSLAARGHTRHLYSLMFSYVLDGLLWDSLRAKGAMVSTDITAAHPFWNGAFWFVYPKRSGRPGTNGYGIGNVTALVTWTGRTLPGLQALTHSPDFRPFIRHAATGLTGPHTIADGNGHSWQFRAADMLVIRESENDPLYHQSRMLADKVAGRLLNPQLLAALRRDIPGGEGQVRVIAAHEFIWEILAKLIAEGQIAPPAIRTDGPDASASLAASDIADVLTIVVKR